MTYDIELAFKRGKIPLKLLIEYYQESLKKTKQVPCGTCDSLEDDGTCPECNGEGLVDSNEYECPRPEEVELAVENYIASRYTELRKREYPDLGEQLDMLYRDMTNGTTSWIDLISSIKSKYPKVT